MASADWIMSWQLLMKQGEPGIAKKLNSSLMKVFVYSMKELVTEFS